MSDFWREFWIEFCAVIDSIINAISTYVHSPLSIEIDKIIAQAFNEFADAVVYAIRDIMDIFGR